MTLGQRSAYVILSENTLIDGKPCELGQRPEVGQSWHWHGEAMRLDGAQSTLLLQGAIGDGALRKKAMQSVNRSFGFADSIAAQDVTSIYENEMESGFVVTDGIDRFILVPIDSPKSPLSLLWCPAGLPNPLTNYTVAEVGSHASALRQMGGATEEVICFAGGTKIRTLYGDLDVEALNPGDQVLTMDSGPQPILWIGRRKVSGARLYAMPELRPIRIRQGALDTGAQTADLHVSPHHRMLLAGPNTRMLFNNSEVLLRACDLVNDSSIHVDYAIQELTYYHILLPQHEVVWANGLPTESFHPAGTSLRAIEPDQREGLLNLMPHVKRDSHAYGPFVRRSLDQSEAAILQYDRR